MARAGPCLFGKKSHKWGKGDKAEYSQPETLIRRVMFGVHSNNPFPLKRAVPTIFIFGGAPQGHVACSQIVPIFPLEKALSLGILTR